MSPATTSSGSTSTANGVVVELRAISKHFPGVQALADVSLEVGAGEIVGLAGENGSGKSTLMKVLAGSYHCDEGEIRILGEPVRLASPADALDYGVALVAQEVHVQGELSVAENVLFGRMPRGRLGLIDWAAAHAQAADVLGSLNLSLDPRERLADLPLHHQHMVSISKMLHRRPRVLILDEPTSSLPRDQVATLFGALRELRDAGSSVVYISHRLREYFELCDRLVVLRDGVKVAERDTADVDEDQLVQLMVGRTLSSLFVRPAKDPRPSSSGTRPLLRIQGLSTPSKLSDVHLHVARGEIVGIAGQAGAGRSTLARALFGVQAYSGSIEVDGEPVELRSPIDAISAGIAFVPDDRKGAGLVLTSSVRENLTMPSWSSTSRFGIRSRAAESAIVDQAIAQLRIRVPSPSTQTLTLSGGNQQKVVIAKWMARNPKLLILDEPTRGVDVGAKDELYRLIDRLAASGLGVLVCSSELLELLRLADRIVVMRWGRIVGEEPGDAASEESITAMAFSGAHETDAGR